MNTPIYKVIPIDPHAPIVVDKISDIETWQKDLAQLAKHDRNIGDQQHRSTRADKFENRDRLHSFEFSDRLQATIDKLLIKHDRAEYSSSKPTFAQYAGHFSYNKILTDNEKLQVEAAKRQREYKKVVYIEHEELLKPDLNQSMDLRKANQKTRHLNAWLLHTINNELVDLYECGVQESGDYLTILGIKADYTKFVKDTAKAKIENKKHLAAEAKQSAINKAQADHEAAAQTAKEAKANLEIAMAANQ